VFDLSSVSRRRFIQGTALTAGVVAVSPYLSKLEAFGLFLAAVEEHAGTAELPHGPLFGLSDFDTFHGMVRSAGFRDSSVKELPIAWRTASLDSYLASFADWADLDEFPEKIRDAIKATVRDRAKDYRSGNLFVMPNPAILISGVKRDASAV